MELDKSRTLRFRNKAIKKIEGIFKCKISKLNLNDLGIDDIIKIIHAGLIHEDPTLTPAEVEDLLDEYMELGEVIAKMTEAFKIAFGSPNEQRVAGESGTGEKL